jgi:hypothetical protein
MTNRKHHKLKPEVHELDSDLPAELAKPAWRALVGAGYLHKAKRPILEKALRDLIKIMDK